MSEPSARELLVMEIAKLEGELRRRRNALRALDRSEELSYEERSSPTQRFRSMRPIDAMKIVLSEQGPMTRKQITDVLMAGGIAIGRIRKDHNVRISINKNLEIGNLKEENGLIHYVGDGAEE